MASIKISCLIKLTVTRVEFHDFRNQIHIADRVGWNIGGGTNTEQTTRSVL